MSEDNKIPDHKKEIEPAPEKSWLFLSKNTASKTKNIYIYLLVFIAVAIIFAIVILGALGYLPEIGSSSSI
ncbi:MAG: hypothetical protein WCQ71_01175 [Bacilli bacterium]|jgi:t-SNARE complex subunit (syntaxin)